MIDVIILGLALGVGLAMDAFAVSMSNGLNDQKMKVNKIILIAGMFALFQGVMPLIGYFVGHVFLQYIEKFIPWIALLLLGFLGGKMIIDGIKCRKEKEEECDCQENNKLTFKILIVQAIATSIDALSTGVTFSDFTVMDAIFCVIIIAVITFFICYIGVLIGKKFGNKLSKYSDFIGGSVLILIGIEIFIKGLL